MYEKDDNFYCYPETQILKNKLNIKDKKTLEAAERDLTVLRLAALKINPLNNTFDLKHLKNIHKYIFQDVYTWAGELRKIEISKGEIMFAKSNYIFSQGNKLFEELKNENYLSGLYFNKFTERLAYYKAEINILHPFREGNGRVIREFIRCLAEYNGYDLDFSLIDKEKYMEAMIQSPYTIGLLKELFKKTIKPMEKEK
ncbi:MAG: cell filamentation protein Fic [Firmicutes bacterium]|nr:cell filamentation protein Fic [Bacillota bacterium]